MQKTRQSRASAKSPKSTRPRRPPAPRREKDPQDCTLAELCDLVIACKQPLEDLAELVEDRAFAEAESHGVEKSVHHLARLAGFFETLGNKNEEHIRDLVDVYVLIGEMYQYYEKYADSIDWLHKGIVANDRASAPFHSLAVSYMKLNAYPDAIRSLEQEVALAPGNYFSYLTLADLYESQGLPAKVEETYKRLLERDPDNIQALHRLIMHYRKVQPDADVELLRRRLVRTKRDLNKVELTIWACHMCAEKRFDEVLRHLAHLEENSPELTIVHLIKAHIFGEQGQFAKKRAELITFKSKNDGRDSFILSKLSEFEEIFGPEAMTQLMKRLAIAEPATVR